MGDLFVGVGQSLKQVFGPLSNQIGLGVKANAGKVLGKDFADAWDLRKVCGHGSGARQFALDREVAEEVVVAEAVGGILGCPQQFVDH